MRLEDFTPWTPPADAERIVTLAITRRREEMTRRQRTARSDIAEQMSARGLGRSGPFYGAVSRSAVDLLHEFGVGLLEDFLATAEDLRWDPDTASWLEEKYRSVIDSVATGVAANLDHEKENRAREITGRVAVELKRDAEIAFARARLRRSAAVAATPSGTLPLSERRDVFISHAGEDRGDVAEPLANELMLRDRSVWFSGYEFTLGDSLLQKINRGLAESRYGVVVLSPDFFRKPWPQAELDGLAARAVAESRKVILPVWHRITQAEIAKHAPTLANLFAVETTRGIPAVADEVIRALDSGA